MGQVKHHLITVCETIGIDPTECRSWDIVDQLDNHRATIVGVKCGYGRSARTFRYRFLIGYHRGVFLAHRDVTAAVRRVIPGRSDDRFGPSADCVTVASGERINCDDARGILVYGPSEREAKAYVERQLTDRLGLNPRFEWT